MVCILVIGARARVGSLGIAFQDQQYQLETSQIVLAVKYHPWPGHHTRKLSTEKEATASARKSTVTRPLPTSVALLFHQHSFPLATVAIPPFKKKKQENSKYTILWIQLLKPKQNNQKIPKQC